MQKDCRNNPCHRFGSSLNANFHYHCVVIDGVLAQDEEGQLRFFEATELQSHDVDEVERLTRQRVLRLFERRGCDVQGCTNAASAGCTRAASRPRSPPRWPPGTITVASRQLLLRCSTSCIPALVYRCERSGSHQRPRRARAAGALLRASHARWRATVLGERW